MPPPLTVTYCHSIPVMARLVRAKTTRGDAALTVADINHRSRLEQDFNAKAAPQNTVSVKPSRRGPHRYLAGTAYMIRTAVAHSGRRPEI